MVHDRLRGSKSIPFYRLLLPLLISGHLSSVSSIPKYIRRIQRKCGNMPLDPARNFTEGGRYIWEGDSDRIAIVPENTPVRFNCRSVIYVNQQQEDLPPPPLFMRWTRFETDVETLRKRFIRYGCQKSPPMVNNRMMMKKARISDSGKYSCQVTRNDTGEVVKKMIFTLLVTNEESHSPPVARTGWDDLEGLKSINTTNCTSPEQNITLDCSYHMIGNIEVDINWTVGGTLQISNGTKTTVLCRNRTYVCRVRNKLGSFRKVFHLQPNFTDPVLPPPIDMTHFRPWLTALPFVAVILMIATVLMCKQRMKKRLKRMNLVGNGMYIERLSLDVEPTQPVTSHDSPDAPSTTNSPDYCRDVPRVPAANFPAIPTDAIELVSTKEVSRDRVICDGLSGERPVVLGSGFFGHVFKGYLSTMMGESTPIAVKVLRSGFRVGDLMAFIEEAKTLIKAGNHPNVISLVGTCIIDTLSYEARVTFRASITSAALMAKGRRGSSVLVYCNRPTFSSKTAAGKREFKWSVPVHETASLIREKEAEGELATLEPPLLLMELADGGNLRSHLLRCRAASGSSAASLVGTAQLSDSSEFGDLLSFSLQTSLGMEHLSGRKILHRDLAARNILLTKDRVVKIGDFGLSKHMDKKNYYRVLSRWEKPLKWTAPEALLYDKFTVESDVWSFGILLWEIFSLGRDPYPSISPKKLYNFLRSGKRLPKPHLATQKIYDVILTCWKWDPRERPTFEHLSTVFRELIDDEENKSASLRGSVYSDLSLPEIDFTQIEYPSVEPPEIEEDSNSHYLIYLASLFDETDQTVPAESEIWTIPQEPCIDFDSPYITTSELDELDLHKSGETGRYDALDRILTSDSFRTASNESHRTVAEVVVHRVDSQPELHDSGKIAKSHLKESREPLTFLNQSYTTSPIVSPAKPAGVSCEAEATTPARHSGSKVTTAREPATDEDYIADYCYYSAVHTPE